MEPHERTQKLLERLDALQVTGPGWSGSARRGFQFNPPLVEEVAGGGVSGGGPPPPEEPTGACCVGVTCSIRTAADCAAHSGVYKGDGTDCTPNPCCSGFEPFFNSLDGLCYSRITVPGCESCGGIVGSGGWCYENPVICSAKFATQVFSFTGCGFFGGACAPSGELTTTRIFNDSCVSTFIDCTGAITFSGAPEFNCDQFNVDCDAPPFNNTSYTETIENFDLM